MPAAPPLTCQCPIEKGIGKEERKQKRKKKKNKERRKKRKKKEEKEEETKDEVMGCVKKKNKIIKCTVAEF